MKNVSWLVLGFLVLTGCESDDNERTKEPRLIQLEFYDASDDELGYSCQVTYGKNLIKYNCTDFDNIDNKTSDENIFLRLNENRISKIDFEYEWKAPCIDSAIFEYNSAGLLIKKISYQNDKENNICQTRFITTKTFQYTNSGELLYITESNYSNGSNSDSRVSGFKTENGNILEEYDTAREDCLVARFEYSTHPRPERLDLFFFDPGEIEGISENLVSKEERFDCRQDLWSSEDITYKFDENNRLRRIDISGSERNFYAVFKYETF